MTAYIRTVWRTLELTDAETERLSTSTLIRCTRLAILMSNAFSSTNAASRLSGAPYSCLVKRFGRRITYDELTGKIDTPLAQS
jgi:hypothetical protein